MGKKADNHLPKRIAGMKIPKAIRRHPLAVLLGSAFGGDVAANLLADLIERPFARDKGFGDIARALRKADGGDRLAAALAAGARAFLAALDEAPRRPAAPEA
jgi:hypothetical protein